MQENIQSIQEDNFKSTEFLEKEKKFLERNKLSKITKDDDVIIDVPYARVDNFCKMQLYSHPFIYLHEEARDNLVKLVSEAKKLNCKIKIWDGFRPFKVQAFMAQKFPDYVDDGYVSHPKEGIATHVRGIAIDLTLVDANTDKELDMGTYFDQMDLKAHHGAEALSDEQNHNRDILKNLMIKAGFEIYENEWWHYNLKIFDRDNQGEIIGALENEHKKYPKILEDFSELCSVEINEFYSKNILELPNQTPKKTSCNCSFFKALNSFKKIFTSHAL
jgi:D-alanyl-D-alanine dipeptidase